MRDKKQPVPFKAQHVEVCSEQAVITIGDKRRGVRLVLTHDAVSRWHVKIEPITPKTPLPPYTIRVKTKGRDLTLGGSGVSRPYEAGVRPA